MSVKIGINGLGRIGKMVLRHSFLNPEIEVVQVNDKMNIDLMAHLLKYDSLHGKFDAKIEHDSKYLYVNDHQIEVSTYACPADIPWHKNDVRFVVESSGRFKTRPLLKGHIENGAEKVILSCPANDDSIDRTIVMGVNHETIQPSDKIISNASCTTNCVAIMMYVLCKEFGVKRGFMNTVHPMTNNQNLQDGFHSDFRRARAAINNIIPTTSSAVKTTQIVLPELEGIFDGFATRVPVADCSFVEVCAQLEKTANIDSMNAAFRKYAEGSLKPYLEYCSDPIVSSDVTNNKNSAIYDVLATKLLGNDFVQILAWYDNEFGYSSRIIDLIKYLAI